MNRIIDILWQFEESLNVRFHTKKSQSSRLSSVPLDYKLEMATIISQMGPGANKNDGKRLERHHSQVLKAHSNNNTPIVKKLIVMQREDFIVKTIGTSQLPTFSC